MKEIGIGIMGFGTVGAGVVEGLQNHGDLITERTGVKLVLRRIADLDLDTDRGVAVEKSILTTNAQEIIDDPEIQIVVELIGGVTVAKDLTLAALANGKSVVTANKALLAEHGPEIHAAVQASEGELYFEASVAGGIPIIKALREGLVGNEIKTIYGIMNGTCNYILTRMETEKLPFDQVLKEAQDLGFAEAEPSLDIDGIDTAHKAILLASLVAGYPVPMDQAYTEGIRGMAAADIQYAHELGYRIKLLGIIKNLNGELEIRIHPTLVHLEHVLADVDGVFNAVVVTGSVVGETMYYGKGAGREATASAVIGDIVDVALNLAHGASGRLPYMGNRKTPQAIRSIDQVESRYYVRMQLIDQPGTMSKVTNILGLHGISLASVVQKELKDSDYTPVVMLTHQVSDDKVATALAEIGEMEISSGDLIRIRIEDF